MEERKGKTVDRKRRNKKGPNTFLFEIFEKPHRRHADGPKKQKEKAQTGWWERNEKWRKEEIKPKMKIIEKRKIKNKERTCQETNGKTKHEQVLTETSNRPACLTWATTPEHAKPVQPLSSRTTRSCNCTGWRFVMVTPWSPWDTRGSGQDIHRTRVPPRRKAVDGPNHSTCAPHAVSEMTTSLNLNKKKKYKRNLWTSFTQTWNMFRKKNQKQL